MKRGHRLAVLIGLVITATAALSTTTQALTATDTYGQDWTINVGPYGGIFPGTISISGTRDTDQSLECGGALPLDGTGTVSPDYQAIVLSMTAYKIFDNSSCVSTHWTGAAQLGNQVFVGLVSNEFGQFGVFGLCLGVASCSLPFSTPSQTGDPATTTGASRWIETQQQ